MLLPCLSLVRNCGEWIFFFIDIKGKIRYAVAEKDNEYWWVEEIE